MSDNYWSDLFGLEISYEDLLAEPDEEFDPEDEGWDETNDW